MQDPVPSRVQDLVNAHKEKSIEGSNERDQDLPEGTFGGQQIEDAFKDLLEKQAKLQKMTNKSKDSKQNWAEPPETKKLDSKTKTEQE